MVAVEAVFIDAATARPVDTMLLQEKLELVVLHCQCLFVPTDAAEALFETCHFLFEGLDVKFLAFAMCSIQR